MDSNAVITRFKEAHQITGVFTRVADRLKVTSNHVREVALGKRTSSRVMKELCAEVRRIERASRLERAA